MEKTLKHLLITGANKGIGYGIIDMLLANKSSGYKIILAVRSLENGNLALKELKSKHKELAELVSVHQLDITDSNSVDNFFKVVETEYESRIDCLVNNAGVAIKGPEFNTKVFDFTLGTNYYSTVDFTEKILEKGFISESGKIIFVASSLGKMNQIKKQELADRFLDKELNEEKLLQLSKEFRASIEDNTYSEKGWPSSAYGISKLLLNKYSLVLSTRKSILDHNIQVYSCCPGWVRTDMGGPQAYRSLEEGSVNPVYLIDLEYTINKELQGKFFYDCKVDDIDVLKI